MDIGWILLVWLVAVAAIYFAVTYWARMAAMRRRLFQDVEREEELDVESGERESRIARWLMLAGFRSRSAPGTFFLACVTALVVGALLVLALNASGAMRFLGERVAQSPPA